MSPTPIPAFQLASVRDSNAHYMAFNWFDGTIKITVQSGPNGVKHVATVAAHEAETVRFILDLIEKFHETDEGRAAIIHYLRVVHAFWHD